MRSALQLRADLVDQFRVLSSSGFGAATADKLHAPILTAFCAASNQNQAKLSSMAQMRSAAGLQIDSRDFDRAKNAFAINFLAHTACGKFFRSAVTHGDLTVFKYY